MAAPFFQLQLVSVENVYLVLAYAECTLLKKRKEIERKKEKEKEECTEYKVNFEYFQIYTEYSTVMYVCMYARVTFMHVHEHAIGTDNSYWLYKI